MNTCQYCRKVCFGGTCSDCQTDYREQAMLLEALVASIEEEGQTPAKEQLIHTYDGTSLQKKLRAAWADEHEYK